MYTPHNWVSEEIITSDKLNNIETGIQDTEKKIEAVSTIKGDNGQSVWYCRFSRGANKTGNYWSDLTPAPTTANPPKLGDTMVDSAGNIYQITNVVVGTTEEGGGTFDYGPLLTSIKGETGPAGKDAVINVVTQAEYDALADKSGVYFIEG